MIDISKHLNLILNHGYKGTLAIYEGPDQMSVKHNRVVLVKHEDIPENPTPYRSAKDLEWDRTHKTLEYPYSEEHIQENIKKNGHKGNITYCTCVGVPIKYLKEIKWK